MNDNVKELKTALDLISRLTVSGDAVDIIALAKQKIRLVVADLEKSEEVKE
jgi:phosphoglycerate dehydrogenase-like enzyme